jgi:hypothetical protein
LFVLTSLLVGLYVALAVQRAWILLT